MPCDSYIPVKSSLVKALSGAKLPFRRWVIASRGLVYVLRSYPELSETFIVREVEALRSAGVPVTVLSAFRPAVEAPDAPEAIYLGETAGEGRPVANGRLAGTLARDLASLAARPRRTARAARLAVYAMRAARAIPERTARLHAHFANDAAALARYTAALTGLPYRVTAHAYDLFQDPFLLGANLAGAEAIYTVSRVNAAWLTVNAARGGWDAKKVSVLHCGLDLDGFPFREPPPVRTPARLLCVGRLVPKKGHAVLLDAVARLASDGVALSLDLAGDGPLAGELTDRARSLGLASRVSFLGAVEPREVLGRMRESDVVVLASRVAADGDRDGLPVVLVEAMALGVPVVATRVAGIPELVAEDAGRLVAPDDPDALAAAIRACLAEPPAERASRARRGRAMVEGGWDLRTQVRALRP